MEKHLIFNADDFGASTGVNRGILECYTRVGLLAYRTRDEAVAAIRQLCKDYDAHCRAARAVVEAHFNARRVLADLLERSL